MRRHAFFVLVLICPLLPRASGQSVISARSGLVNYLEGVVFLDGQPLARKTGAFAHLKDGSVLLTESGRAEILLTPDTYLRIGEKSSIRMISDSISDTQVELLSGSSILDSSKAPDGAFVKVIFRDRIIHFLKPGHYRIDADPPQLRVYQGEAEVAQNGADGKNDVKIKASQLLPLDGSTVVKRFTQGSDGLLDLWSEERGELIASNMVNSQTITDPLLDSGPDVPADLSSYIGYVPLATIPSVGVSSPGSGLGLGYGYDYGYSTLNPALYPSLYPGLYPGGLYPGGLYPGFGVSVLSPFPSASFLYAPRRYTSSFAGRRSLPSTIRPPARSTIGSPARSTIAPLRTPPPLLPRPTAPAGIPSRVGAPVGVRPGLGAIHSGGARAVGGHR